MATQHDTSRAWALVARAADQALEIQGLDDEDRVYLTQISEGAWNAAGGKEAADDAEGITRLEAIPTATHQAITARRRKHQRGMEA